jgi:polyhydroxybutyrate depolymerase
VREGHSLRRAYVVAGAGLVFAALAFCGCGRGLQSHNQPGDVRTVQAGGMRREYVLDLPPGDERPVGLIIAFHGGYGTPTTFADSTELADAAGRHGFAVALPRSVGRSWNAGDCCGPAHRRGIDDIAFVRALLADVREAVPVDRRRVFVTGISTGGKMAYRTACQMTADFAAVAGVATNLALPPDDCDDGRPIPLLHIHGTADPFAPFKGGDSAQPGVPVQLSVPATMNVWIARDHCADRPHVVLEHEAAKCVSHPCSSGNEVELCTIGGMGHQWPGAPATRPRVLGPGSDDLDASETVVSFFERHPQG